MIFCCIYSVDDLYKAPVTNQLLCFCVCPSLCFFYIVYSKNAAVFNKITDYIVFIAFEIRFMIFIMNWTTKSNDITSQIIIGVQSIWFKRIIHTSNSLLIGEDREQLKIKQPKIMLHTSCIVLLFFGLYCHCPKAQ